MVLLAPGMARTQTGWRGAQSAHASRLGGRRNELVRLGNIEVTDARILGPEVGVITRLQPCASQATRRNECLADWLGFGELATTTIVVPDDDYFSNDAVLNLCKVCHYETTNVPVLVHLYQE